jgi:hypothetical protein
MGDGALPDRRPAPVLERAPPPLLLFLSFVVIQAGWHAIDVVSERLGRGNRRGPAQAGARADDPSVRLLLRTALVLVHPPAARPAAHRRELEPLLARGFWLLQIVGLALLPLLPTWRSRQRHPPPAVHPRRVVALPGDRFGQVSGVSFFHVEVCTPEGEQVLLPHLLMLARPPCGGWPARPRSHGRPAGPRRAGARRRAGAPEEGRRGLRRRQRAGGRAAVSLLEQRPDGSLFRVELPRAGAAALGLLLALAAGLEAAPAEGAAARGRARH